MGIQPDELLIVRQALFHCCNKSMVLLEPGNHTIDTVNYNAPKVGCDDLTF